MPRKRSPRLTEREKYRYLEQTEALIEKVERGPEIKKIEGNRITIEGDRLLTIAERGCVAEVLRRHLPPKRELRTHRRQFNLSVIEALKAGAKRARAKSGISAADWADRVATGLGFQSAKAMEQFVKRERRAKQQR